MKHFDSRFGTLVRTVARSATLVTVGAVVACQCLLGIGAFFVAAFFGFFGYPLFALLPFLAAIQPLALLAPLLMFRKSRARTGVVLSCLLFMMFQVCVCFPMGIGVDRVFSMLDDKIRMDSNRMVFPVS